MRSRTKKLIALGVAFTVSLRLFVFGLSYPLLLRVRGDAYGYLDIARQLTDWSAVLSFAGNRVVGFPFFEVVVGKIVSVFFSSYTLLAWVNAIGVALLIIHIASAWVLSRWARNTNLIATENAALILFVFFATFPALIGHTTTPLSDTLAVDLVVCALMSMHVSLKHDVGFKSFVWAGLAAFLFAFSILVRPGNLSGVVAALMTGMVVALWTANRKATVVGVIMLGCAGVLAPYYFNCTQKYGSVCLQSPATFGSVDSAQVGLLGARLLWGKGEWSPGKFPVMPDEIMFTNYYQRCQLKTIVGITDSSLTGCLMTRPLALPAYMVKKWIGLFDHFRFTPYLEEVTPAWLRWLSRGYDSLAWIGLWLFFLTLCYWKKGAQPSEIRAKLLGSLTPLLLVSYSIVMLAQHTVLHVEDRYGFPLLALCAIMLVSYGERVIRDYRIVGLRRLAPLILYCVAAWVVFVVQIIVWDNATFN
ncbi:hypothetical protein [uncultured Thiodictyon sp.]|uniref:hypothetical protein n=1 Tax=uncultured Thiodictyon sp. TaxID=1846217 RepID=UPI0025F1B578|nr:hypothetical protein [uncultured Thiodictyon sp.]